MAERVAGLKWLLSAGGAAGAVLGIFLLASQSVPERFEAGAPTNKNAELVDLVGHCDEAFRQLELMGRFARTHRSCNAVEDCGVVSHPHGCRDVVSADHADEFELLKQRAFQLQGASLGGCEFPVALCAGSASPVCVHNECSISEPAWRPPHGG